jgi:predicted AAA+ superfamily ATPase
LDNTTIPLTANIKNDKFKIYMLDTGLLISMYNDISVYEQILTNEMRAKKGGIYENFVANTLISQGYDLMYYHKDRHNSVKKEAEIDFCISNDGCSLLPIEIKSGRAPSNSLKHVLKDNNIKYGIKAGRFNIGFQNKVFTIPVYMLMFLDRDRIKTLIH